MTLLALLGRGLVAGCAGGLATGLFALLLTEPVIDRAVRLEAAREHLDPHAEVFSRGTQHVGLLLASLVTGLALGVLFAVVYAVAHRRDPAGDPWRRALRLAAAGFVGVHLLPFLRYPSNPPGVGDPGTIGMRTSAWLVALLISLIAVALTWQLQVWLAERDAAEPVRHLLLPVVPTVALAAMFVLLPANPDRVPVPVNLLWSFRLLSLGAMAVLWGGIGAGFGLLGYRTERAAARRAHPQPVPHNTPA